MQAAEGRVGPGKTSSVFGIFYGNNTGSGVE